MSIRERLSGNEAVANAMRQINPDVVAAFPITPSTEVPQYFSTFVNNGQVDTEFVPVESEHSAMSACIGASAAGGRVMTATSANGLSLMWEMLYIASSLRLPIVMACVNRAVSGPINIHNDHSDSMGARDSGWIQLYSETNQEAYDNAIMAVRIAEHDDVRKDYAPDCLQVVGQNVVNGIKRQAEGTEAQRPGRECHGFRIGVHVDPDHLRREQQQEGHNCQGDHDRIENDDQKHPLQRAPVLLSVENTGERQGRHAGRRAR